MKVSVRGVVDSNPPLAQTEQKDLVEEALRQVAVRVAAVSGGQIKLGADQLGHVQIEMPVALERIRSGYYTKRAAAGFLANRIFKALLPHLPPEARTEDVFQRAVVYGSDQGFGRVQGPPITPEYLRRMGMEPQWRAEVSGVRYHLSQPFLLGSRVAYIAYVEESGAVHVRVFYASQSQGIWRAASHRQEGMGHLGISERWIGKGNPHEESTDLPFELIAELSRRQHSARTDLTPAEAEGLFYGVLEVKSNADYLSGNAHPSEGFYPGEARAIGRFGREIEQSGRSYGDPSSFSFDSQGDAPDFSRVLDTYQVESPMYGGVQGYLFASHNGRLNYLIYRDGRGRSWVASIQDVTSGVTSRGARRQVIDALNLTMPANEYRDQIPAQYRGQVVEGNESYYDAWEYIKRLPFMGELYQTMGWEMPGGAALPAPLPRRSRSYQVGGYVRIHRSGGAISWGQVLSLQGTQAIVSVPAPGGQQGTKPAELTKLLPCYREGEALNVPGLASQPLPGRVQSADWSSDRFTCAAEVPGQGERQITVSGADLDRVN